jgi:Tfp pilus assembly protein PilO
MRERDRLILIGGVVVAVLVVAWMFWVSPERKQATSVHAQVATAQQTLSTAQSQLAAAQGSKAQYASAYSALTGVGKAVPATPEIPSLMYEINQATATHDVTFNSISNSGSAAQSGSATATGTPGGFTPLPISFTFTGTFFDLYHLLGRLQSFEVQTPSGKLEVTGRLLTITGATLTPVTDGGAGSSASSTSSSCSCGHSAPANLKLTGAITATAYVMPPSAPSSGTTGTPATPAAPATTSTPATPAVIR